MAAQAIRTDIQPVVLAGDQATYPIAREFHEAFGVTTICVVPDPIAIIQHSRFIEHYRVERLREDDIRAALQDIAASHADKHVIVMANTDFLIECLERVEGDLPDNVICPLPPHDLMTRVSDKTTFQQLCAEYGMDVPRTETVLLAGAEPIAPSEIGFPLVAKPAASREYVTYFAKGFKKVYFMHGQAELDRLWADLREAGFAGDFLVQELISGDDTYMDSLTLYVNRRGRTTMFASAQVLLEDHAPTLLGNPVSMITKPLPEHWEKVAAMLEGIGWYGFANIDLKRDPATGRAIFMDMNPRIGANSYYACVGGVNPMAVLVEDVVDGLDTVHRAEHRGLYSRCPASLTRKYVLDPKLRAELDAIVAAGDVHNPVGYAADSLPTRLYGWLMKRNYIKKFAKWYPEVSETSF